MFFISPSTRRIRAHIIFLVLIIARALGINISVDILTIPHVPHLFSLRIYYLPVSGERLTTCFHLNDPAS